MGKIDFDKVISRKTNGSLMASPASTAAYLMNCTVWDYESESYLRSAISEGSGKGNGSIPCAFPTTFFEVTWVSFFAQFLTRNIAKSIPGGSSPFESRVHNSMFGKI